MSDGMEMYRLYLYAQKTAEYALTIHMLERESGERNNHYRSLLTEDIAKVNSEFALASGPVEAVKKNPILDDDLVRAIQDSISEKQEKLTGISTEGWASLSRGLSEDPPSRTDFDYTAANLADFDDGNITP